MSRMRDDIIVLDDDDEEEEQASPPEAKASPCNPSKQTNGKQEESSSQQSKAEVISAQNKALFNEFVEYCLPFTLEHPEVISFLQGKYAKASPTYLASVEFRNTVGRCLTRAQGKRSKIFVYINELCTALKANSQKRKVSLQTQAVQQPASAASTTAATLKTETLTENDEEAEYSPVKKTGSKRQIRYLENLLRIYSQEIKKLQEKDLSLEDLDDEDSTYIQESRLKRKLLRIFEKLCELKDCSSLTGRVIEQRILYRGTRYPEVNRRLEKFINASRELPDYGDVLRVIERANDKHRLGLSRKQMQSMAQDAFRELGNKLQDRRHLDMIYNFGCHLTDSYKSVNDPAQQDSSLARRLRENRNTAMSRLEDIIKKYADLQDDGEGDFRMKMRSSQGPERSKPSSPETSEEEEDSEDSETDIEEELEHSKKVLDSDEGENEEEELPGDQENEADQKMDMASGGEDDGDKDKEDGDDENVMEEQESSPASTSASSSHDKDSPNTTIESEAEAAIAGSPDPLTLSPAKAKSDEHNDEPEACATPTNAGDQEEEEDEEHESGPSDVDRAADKFPNCESPSDIQENTAKHKGSQKYLLPDMTVSIAKDKDNSDGEDLTEPRGDPSCEGVDSDSSESSVDQEKSSADVNRRKSTDSEAASMEEEPLCTDTAINHDDDDDAYRSPADSPVPEREAPASSVHAKTEDRDTCEKETDCDLSPLGGSNGVHIATQVRSTPINRLKLNKATIRDSPKSKKTEEDSPPPNRKRKNLCPEKWTMNNGLTRYNGKKYTEELTDRHCKRAKLDCSYTSLSSSSDSEFDLHEEDSQTPGLMMTCSPMETPEKPTKKSHTVSTQCDPDEVIVLSD